MDKKFFLIMVVIALILGSAAICSGTIPIGEEDVLQISVWDHPELTVTVPVRPGGVISVPFVGEAKAAGLTPQELKAELEKEFSAFIKVPTVSVVVTQVNSFKVYMFGAGIHGGSSESASVQSGASTGPSTGASSGVITLRRETSLIQLLSQVGFNKNADLRKAYLMRAGKKLNIDFYKLVNNGDTSQDVQLRPNDVIFVPENMEQSIRVVGAVRSPGILPFSDGMTALDAVLGSGGFNEFASQNNVTVVRKEADQIKNIRVKLKDVINDGDVSKNLALQPGDIVSVSTSLF